MTNMEIRGHDEILSPAPFQCFFVHCKFIISQSRKDIMKSKDRKFNLCAGKSTVQKIGKSTVNTFVSMWLMTARRGSDVLAQRAG